LGDNVDQANHASSSTKQFLGISDQHSSPLGDIVAYLSEHAGGQKTSFQDLMKDDHFKTILEDLRKVPNFDFEKFKEFCGTNKFPFPFPFPHKDPQKALKNVEARELDGEGNNEAHPEWGAVHRELVRVTDNSYTDGKGLIIPKFIAGPNGPIPNPEWIEPRDVSNAIMAQAQDTGDADGDGNTTENIDIPNSFGINEYFQFFGQFLTHDIAEVPLAVAATTPPADVIVPLTGVPIFLRTPTESLGHEDGSQGGELAVREQENEETAFLDLSTVYGKSVEMLDLLREDIQVNGQTVKSAHLLSSDTDAPVDEQILPTLQFVADHHNADLTAVRNLLDPNSPINNPQQFAMGDQRGNQNAALLTHQTMWMRNHNWHVDQLSEKFPSWTQEELFEAARAMNEAEWQNVVYDEYLAKLLGAGAIDKYSGYDPNVDPSVINEWTSVAFRFGHDQSSDHIPTLAEAGANNGDFTLAQAFQLANAATAIRDSGSMDDWVRGQLAFHTQEIDGKVVDGNRNLLFGVTLPNGTPLTFDLEVFDIMRGRDHGVGSYKVLYEGLFGQEADFDAYDSFAEFVTRNSRGDAVQDAALLDALLSVYGDFEVDADGNSVRGGDSAAAFARADSVVMGLLEKPDGDGMLGETFTLLTVMQFENLRDGDQQFYLERFKDNPALLAEIESTTMADIIARTTGIEHVYHDGFAAHNRIGGDAASNVVSGLENADLLIGFAGNDELRGNKGDDDIYGGDGKDKLYGGDGADILDGGAGNDKYWGGKGADVFVFGKGDKSDEVKDFEYQDKIDLQDFGFKSYYQVLASAKQVGGSTVIDLGQGDKVQLTGVKLWKLSADNFILNDNHDDGYMV